MLLYLPYIDAMSFYVTSDVGKAIYPNNRIVGHLDDHC